MDKLKVMTVFGTRPDAVKMAPLVKVLKKESRILSSVCVTAQHRQMLDQVLRIFDIEPEFDLDIMEERQTLEYITSKVIEEFGKILSSESPDIVLVHGDTTTCFAAALSAFYHHISVGHVEAGLRTFDKYSPFPEEMNRKLTGAIADLHFAPTLTNKTNLLNEGVSENKIYVTGNTALDALKTTVNKNYSFRDEILKGIDISKSRVIAVTAHRRENLGEPLENICRALKHIAQTHSDVKIIYAVHLNPAVSETAHRILGDTPNIHLIAPLDVQDMHNLLDRSYMIMTDSGGIQEEAPALGKPVLVLRKETERPEAVKAGTVKLAGISEESIVSCANELLSDKSEYTRMAHSVNPYGDGHASERIVQALLFEYGIACEKPKEFGN